MMKKAAIITARGGSKRIPRKNIRNFCGRPILAYSIEAALGSGVFDTVMVSTEDEEIAAVARQYGAEVPFLRSRENAGDFASTAQVILEVLQEYKRRDREYDQVCCIYPTAPFLTAERLREAMDLLEKTGADCVQPVVRFSFPPQRCLVEENGMLKFKWPQYRNARSQDLEPYYHDAGQFYCLDRESFERQGVLVMEKTIPLILQEMEVQDIDSQEDWAIAEVKYRLRGERGL